MRTHDDRFEPPFCPNPACRFHRGSEGWTWCRTGWYPRQAPPRWIRRFRCLTCRRNFSTQTFDTTYWLKKPHLQVPLLHGLVACSGFRQLGRSLSVAGTTLQRQASRLGRHCLLHHEMRRPRGVPGEPLVLDGLISFEYSQFWPVDVTVLVGKRSHYVYAFAGAELRRSGRMTSDQARRRDELEQQFGRPDPRATEKAVRAVLEIATPAGAQVRVHSDEHAAYPRAFRKCGRTIEHATVSSRRCRTARNPLFAADLFDLLVRHGGSNHERETIAFSKPRQAIFERMAIVQCWRNDLKRVSEKRRDSPTPSQALGLGDGPMQPDELLYRRLFPTRIRLPTPLADYYWRNIPTRQIPNGTSHRLKYAF